MLPWVLKCIFIRPIDEAGIENDFKLVFFRYWRLKLLENWESEVSL